ncbi:MAG: ABC transporter ATP-binding protein [Desulfopila sp.]|jgi:ABC-type Fe3+/spermidine/putrescine transport system ATPase subunit|nr:ABC transporter ATP-binding protein [Desulfopila sp.]
MKTAPILEINSLSNSYQGALLLDNISFSLSKGEILCLLGPSGSGKTTLLRLVAGLEKEYEGTIIFAGRDVRGIPPHQRNFGMMFQEYALFPHRNVHQNITFGLEMQGYSSELLAERLQTVLDLVGLKDLTQRRIDELSGGERQRVALARSLAPEPHLLLLDEPLGSLDRTLRDRLTAEIRAILKKRNMTTIFVTHDQAEAFSIADKVAVLHAGRLQQLDSPESLYRRPLNKTVAGFLGFTNLVSGNLEADGTFLSPLGSLQIENAEGKIPRQATLLLRPEGAVLCREKVRGGFPVIAAKIMDRVFQGSTYRVTLQVGTVSLIFDLPIDPSPPPNGEIAHLLLNPAALVLLQE